MSNYFIFNGKDSRDFGIHLAEYPPRVIPPERVTEATIPGRSGTLHIKEGEDIFDSYNQTITLTALDERRMSEIQMWLRGLGTLTFGNDLDYFYEVNFKNEADFARTFRRWHNATIAYEVQPFKKLRNKQIYKLSNLDSDQMINVKTAFKCPFKMTVKTNKVLQAMTLFINDETITYSSNAIHTIVDTEFEEITYTSGINIDEATASTFPIYFKPGKNIIRAENVSEIEIETRGRFI